MKRIIIAAMLLITIGANAQLNIVDRLRVKTSLQLGARAVTGISDDTTGTTLSANNLITERAAKLLVTSRLASFTGGSSSWASITGKPSTLSGYGITDNITIQGNTFNGVNQLLRLNSAGAIPALDGGLITGLSKLQIGLPNVPNVDATNASNINTGTLNDLRLSTNVSLDNINNNFSANQTISKTTPVFTLKDINDNNLILTKNESNNFFTATNEVFEVGGALSNGLFINAENQFVRNTTQTFTFGTQITVAFWLKQIPVGQPNYSPVLYFTDGTNSMHFTVVGGMRYRYNGTATVLGGTGGGNLWAHYVFVINGSTLTCYLNGAFQGSGSISGRLTTANRYYVGYQEEGSSPFFLNYAGIFSQFHIDQLLVYNTALSQSNVTDLYSNFTGNPLVPLASNLRLKLDFNEGVGNTVTDGSSSLANGNLLNNPAWLIEGGKVPTEGVLQNALLIRSRDGIGTGNRGEVTFGDPFGGTTISGRTIRFTGLAESFAGLLYKDGRLCINNPTDNNTDPLQVNGAVIASQFKLSGLNTAPASATAVGSAGEIRIVNGFIYVCVATNTWQRSALTTW